MGIRSIYESDLSGQVIPENELVEFLVRRNGEETLSHLSEQELAAAIEDEEVLSAIVLHDQMPDPELLKLRLSCIDLSLRMHSKDPTALILDSVLRDATKIEDHLTRQTEGEA